MIFLTGWVTTFFFFPFYPTFLPSVNTKMMMAACGLVALAYNLTTNGRGKMNKDFLILSLVSMGVSMASLLAMVINDTPDDSYLDYFVSMWVWLGAAYFMVNMIKFTHGRANVELICYYLISVGVCQCILAETMDHVPIVKTWVDSILSGEGFMGKNTDRLYGLGCALDVAGSRFAVLLIIIAFLLPKESTNTPFVKKTCLLLFSFGIIAFIGNSIGRTAVIGMVIGIAFLVLTIMGYGQMKSDTRSSLTQGFLIFVFSIATIGTFLYNADAKWQKSIEFGFEGFFSLARKGKWEVHSNEMLKGGYVFPDNLKTWIIGDGYMAPTTNDPYYVGKTYIGFYKDTDVGYSRFIFYFGLIGLAAFSVFMVVATKICMSRFKNYKMLFALMLLVNFIVWLKVSTDIFLCFAPFLALTAPNEDEDLDKQHLSLQ